MWVVPEMKFDKKMCEDCPNSEAWWKHVSRRYGYLSQAKVRKRDEIAHKNTETNYFN